MRVHYVNKARKDQGSCEKCHEPIVAGSGYKYIEPRLGPKRKRHATCPTWRQSEMTGGKMAGVYAAQEGFEDFMGEWDGQSKDDAVSALMDVAEGVREVAEEYRESASNMEEGFGHATSMTEELEEKADELDSWADDVENALDGEDDFDEEAARKDAKELADTYDPETAEAPTDDELDEAVEEARTEWADGIRSTAEDAVNECPV